VSVAFDNKLIIRSVNKEHDNYEVCVRRCDWLFRCLAVMFDLIGNECYFYLDQTFDFDAMHIFTLHLSSFKNIFQAKSEKRGKQLTGFFSFLF
jgi:hypothetical protein